MPPGSTTLLSCRSGKLHTNSGGQTLAPCTSGLHLSGSREPQACGSSPGRRRRKVAPRRLFLAARRQSAAQGSTTLLSCRSGKQLANSRGTNAGTLHVRSSLVWQQGTTGVWFFLGAQPLQGRCATAASQVPQKVAQTTSSGVGAFSNPAFSGCSVKGFFNTS